MAHAHDDKGAWFKIVQSETASNRVCHSRKNVPKPILAQWNNNEDKLYSYVRTAWQQNGVESHITESKVCIVVQYSARTDGLGILHVIWSTIVSAQNFRDKSCQQNALQNASNYIKIDLNLDGNIYFKCHLAAFGFFWNSY